MIISEEFRGPMEAALAELALAERAMSSVLDALRARPRAEKVTITDVILAAFARVRAARAHIGVLRASCQHA